MEKLNENLKKYRRELRITQISGTLALSYFNKYHYNLLPNKLGISFFIGGGDDPEIDENSTGGILENNGRWYKIHTLNNKKLNDAFLPPNKVRIYTQSYGPFLFDLDDNSILYESSGEKFKIFDFLLKPGPVEHFFP